MRLKLFTMYSKDLNDQQMESIVNNWIEKNQAKWMEIVAINTNAPVDRCVIVSVVYRPAIAASEGN